MAAPATPAAATLALFVAGAEVQRAPLRNLADAAIEQLLAHGLLERHADRLRSPVAILPLGAALLVCDRLDAPLGRDLVCWPDDSSHHLAAAIPAGRRTDWLDLGCGSAFAPLARPELAQRITGIDINPRAVRHAQLGAALSGISHLAASIGDISDAHAPADLVTCNAPMPDPNDQSRPPSPGSPSLTDRLRSAMTEVWRHADPGFFAALWSALPRTVRPGGMIVVHGASDMILPVLHDAPGERVVVTYTPDGVQGFAIAWWRPDAPPAFAAARRMLTPERPHIDFHDRDDALA